MVAVALKTLSGKYPEESGNRLGAHLGQTKIQQHTVLNTLIVKLIHHHHVDLGRIWK
jgi:hypothetical protein